MNTFQSIEAGTPTSVPGAQNQTAKGKAEPESASNALDRKASDLANLLGQDLDLLARVCDLLNLKPGPQEPGSENYYSDPADFDPTPTTKYIQRARKKLGQLISHTISSQLISDEPPRYDRNGYEIPRIDEQAIYAITALSRAVNTLRVRSRPGHPRKRKTEDDEKRAKGNNWGGKREGSGRKSTAPQDAQAEEPAPSSPNIPSATTGLAPVEQ